MATDRSAQLIDAMRSRQLVRFSRRFEDWQIAGYVLDVGPKFFLLALVSDRMWFDGFECFRISDIRNVKSHPYTKFVESVLKKRKVTRLRKPKVSVASVEDLLRSAGRAFPLVTIHREQVDPDACWIGRVVQVTHNRVSFLEIGPDAVWDDALSEYGLSQITRVNFGGDYEEALYLVGGDAKRRVP
ncbi:MAG: hypothetical protein JOZ83_15875 [Silvibacterium sp.]|nr:hypothetical protein [Silvibacterium sp.]